MDCCASTGWADCARNPDDYDEKYNFLKHGMFFSDLNASQQRGENMQRFFERCHDKTLLGPEVEHVNGQTKEVELKRFPISVLKADEMLPDALSLANFARANGLNVRLVFVTRH